LKRRFTALKRRFTAKKTATRSIREKKSKKSKKEEEGRKRKRERGLSMKTYASGGEKFCKNLVVSRNLKVNDVALPVVMR
jgi:hypothetical protein